MKIPVLIVLVSFTLLLIPYQTVSGQKQIEYTIRIDSDGSADWIIRTIGINISFDLFEFQDRVTSLVEAAKNRTGRDMVAVKESFSMNFTYSGSYGITEYRFCWRNFSITENGKIIIGDVFQVEDFFLQFYGDGEIYMTYPPQYMIEAVTEPFPHERDDSIQKLKWLGTNDFKDGQPTIILEEKSLTSGLLDVLKQNAIIIATLVTIAIGFSVGFYLFRHHRKKATVKVPEIPSIPGMESAEEKIVKMLQSSGGSMFQSTITDKCKFSKAKTSQLLTVLEQKGIVRRFKKGRDKIVTLVQQDKSENQ